MLRWFKWGYLMPSKKRCVVCGGETPRSGSTRGYRLTCSSECLRASKSKHSKAAIKVVRSPEDAFLNHRRRSKLLVLHHYSNGKMICACCGIGYVEFLTIDHINGGGAAHRRTIGNGKLANGGGAFYTWLRKNGYPEGYRVLCQNCNFSRGIFGYCPHETRNDLLQSALQIFYAGSKNVA